MARKGYLQIKCSESERDTLRRLAAGSQVTVSDWIRGAIRAKTTSQIGALKVGLESELEAIRRELKAPDFEYLQLLFVPGDPAKSLELWCRNKAQLGHNAQLGLERHGSKRQEWYLEHAKRIAELRNRTQTSPKIAPETP